jgi:hypothetical protein
LRRKPSKTSRSSTERASEVYVSPGKADDWQNDVLGKDSLDDGRTANIKFNRASKTCIWDLKVVYADDDWSAVWHDINLCKIEKITIKYNRRSETTSATFD